MTYDFEGIKHPDDMFFEHIGDWVIHVYDERDGYERYALIREYEDVGPDADFKEVPYVTFQYRIKDYEAFKAKYPGMKLVEYDLYEYARRNADIPHKIKQDDIVWRMMQND